MYRHIVKTKIGKIGSAFGISAPHRTQNRHYFAVFIAVFAEIGILTAEIGNPKVKIGIFGGKTGKPTDSA